MISLQTHCPHLRLRNISLLDDDMSITAVAEAPNPNALDGQELTLQIPVWVYGKRKWVTGISKKTTFDDLIYALLVQAELLKATPGTINTSSNGLPGYAIAECLQLAASSTSNSNESEPASLITQRIIKGRGKVVKAYKSWQFDKLPLTVLHLIPTTSNSESHSSTAKFRSKLFRRFLPTKSPSITSNSSLISSSQSDSSLISIANHPPTTSLPRQKSFHDFHENSTTLEQQKRLLGYLDEQIHQVESSSACRVPYHPDPSGHEVTMHDVSRLFSQQIEQEDQLIFATQLCNSILNMQERLEEKTNVLYAVEQAISNELNHVLHQQHYDTLPSTISLTSNDSNSSLSNDLISLKNSIYRSRELSRVQSKEMHDLDLSLREMEVLLASKYDELKYLEYETSSHSRSLTPNYSSQQQQQQQHYRTSPEEASTYETLDLPTMTTTSSAVFTSMKEMDEDSGINSLTSDDSNHHSVLLTHQKMPTQLETLV